MTKPHILILHARGTNRDREAGLACELAGGAPEIVRVNQLIAGERRLADYRMLVLPGGFSYGDDLGAGKLWAVALNHRLGDDLAAFVAAGRPVLGICNGFQVLVKAGLLPGGRGSGGRGRGSDGLPPSVSYLPSPTVTLTRNDFGQFECRWVYLQPQPDSPCVFTRGLSEPIYCPVAHGEGKFVARDSEALAALESRGLTTLRYVGPAGAPAGYPWNPNGSQADIAGICNPPGNVLGLMPHPEDHVFAEQHPRFHRGERGLLGLPLFRNGVDYAAAL
ncbi:MAG: phosphoribosylformylglycinamidine synthase I [Chloroflexi bacterium HGW-Chloroflexi-1]|nr:MAG: phosphoribosylformylglycinamidine synthase I [Chloroflexi bacterium HGW-Chloroflexi-1]